MSPEIKLDEFDSQVLLYCKRWYKQSDNRIEDLKKLISRVALINQDVYSEKEIWMFLSRTFCKYASEQQKEEFMVRLFNPFGYTFNKNIQFETMVDILIGHIGNITVAGNEKLPFGIGTPNYNILPEPEHLKKKKVLKEQFILQEAAINAN
jgi:hypothetical protein